MHQLCDANGPVRRPIDDILQEHVRSLRSNLRWPKDVLFMVHYFAYCINQERSLWICRDAGDTLRRSIVCVDGVMMVDVEVCIVAVGLNCWRLHSLENLHSSVCLSVWPWRFYTLHSSFTYPQRRLYQHWHLRAYKISICIGPNIPIVIYGRRIGSLVLSRPFRIGYTHTLPVGWSVNSIKSKWYCTIVCVCD